MFKKVMVSLVILVLIPVAGFGIYYALSQQPQVSDQKIEDNKSSSEPLAKLVYTGTNETLSEALYHLDLQDGKLDEAHITVSIKKVKSTDPYKSKITKFIDKNNKVLKEKVFPYNFDIIITDNGKYAMVHEKIIDSRSNSFFSDYSIY